MQLYKNTRIDQPGVLQMYQPAAFTRNCNNCGYHNPGDVSICLNCTVDLGPRCPTCGQLVAGNSKFCGQCGTSLTNNQVSSKSGVSQEISASGNFLARMPSALLGKIRTASVKQPGERRNATVLLVDLVDFTSSVTGTLDDEWAYIFIDEAMAQLIDVACKYNGTIDKITGNGLMVLFGVPAAHENDPELAIRAAFDMLTAIQSLAHRVEETYGLQFKLRFGISTGDVIAARMGSDFHMEYTVIGETVDLAKNLREIAATGTILVSSETYQRTNTVFEFETIPPAVNSKSPDTGQHYRPLKVLKRRDYARGLTSLQLSLVGRVDELARLERALDIVRKDKQRQIVRLTGEAGIGKSRLVSEFLKKMEPSAIRVHQSVCSTFAHSQPLSVVAEMVRSIMKVTETDHASIQHEAIQRYLDQMNLPKAEIWPYIAYVLGLEQADQTVEARLALLDSTILQRQTHVALRQLFLAEARQAPVIFIFEDLQWLDPSSCRFLEYLLQTTDDIPAMLILVSRSAEPDNTFSCLQPALENESGHLVDLQLEALSIAEQRELVDQFISRNTGEGEIVWQKIIQRGGGNPFYLGELIRMLIDRGGLVQETSNKDWQVTSQAPDLITDVPGTIKDLILTRFDCLPEELRRTLQLGAVLGNSFTTSLLQEIRGLNVDTLAIHLKELEIRQFLSFDSSMTNERYGFQHTLFQEVIYSTLLKRDRQLIHDWVAEAIEANESGYVDDKAECLAYHYFEGGYPVKAAPYLITTADKAALQSAHEIAAERYRRVISLLPDQPNGHSQEFFQVRLGLGRSLKYIGQFSAANQLLTETLPQLWRSSLASQTETLWPVLVEILRQLADIHQRQGTYGEALEYLDTGLQVLGDAGAAKNPRLWCRLVECQAWIHFRQGRLEQSFALANSSVKRLDLEEIDDPIMLARLLNTLGGISWQQGDREKAIDYTRRSLELFQTVGYTGGVATTHNNLGILYDVLGQWAKAIEYHQQAYALQKNIGDIEGQGRSLDSLGILHMKMGRHETARQKIKASLAIRQKLGDRYGIAETHANLAVLALIQQARKEALTNGEAALKLADEIGSSEIQVYARWIVALTQAGQGGSKPGLMLVKEALEMTRHNGFVEGEIDCLRVMGVLQAQGGEHQKALVLFQNSAQLAQKYKDPYRQGLAFLECGLAYLSLVQTDDNNQPGLQAKTVFALDEATKIFETLGADHYQYLAQAALKQLQ